MRTTELLAMLQLGDSFFPSGMFTQSHGLERFIELGGVGEGELAALVESYLLHVAGPSDALAARWVCRLAHTGDLAQIQAIDRHLEATKLASEPRLASRRCGGRLLQLGADLVPDSVSAQYLPRVREGGAPGHQVVALALLAATNGLDEQSAALVELHSLTVSLLSAAVRLGAIDHVTAQRLLMRARPAIERAAETYRLHDWHAISGFAPEIELMQMQHRYAMGHMFVS
jgi:urease accessory protein